MQASRKEKRIRGKISVTGKGVGYLSVEGQDEDIEIAPENMKTALHHDEVEAIVLGKNRFGRVQGKIEKIVDRARTMFVGTVEKKGARAVLIPDNRKIHVNFLVAGGEKLQTGDKAQVKMTGWDEKDPGPKAALLRVIGRKGEHEAEMQSILIEKGFESGFPPEVEAEAEKIKSEEPQKFPEEIKMRRDFRDTLTFTIDPVDAKDFDDALSIKEIGNKKYEIGIHIADVSHYVREGSALDKEAVKRATSVYLVDRTIPMLPEILSNDLCSLNPHEDKMAFSAVFEMDLKGNIHKRWFGKTVINSNKRFTYEEAQASLDDDKGLYHQELVILNTIAKKLREEKFSKGAIDFEQDEVKFVLDEKGVPLKVVKKVRGDSHKLVEEFMLLANREVAKSIFDQHEKHKGHSIYRIHDVPDPDKIEELSIFAKALGYELPAAKGVTAKDIKALIAQVEGKAEESLIKTAAIRSMQKAVYSTKNIGHFGLAFEYYTHFTSPIRRYPDLIVQRVLFALLNNKKIGGDQFAKLEKIAQNSTDKEIAAAEAERGSIKYKQVEYMQKHVGEEFDGIISGVTEWGMYVEEAETKAEGMVSLRSMTDDYYELDKKNYAIIGQAKKKKYSLGDKVRVKLTGADLDKKTLDYSLI